MIFQSNKTRNLPLKLFEKNTVNNAIVGIEIEYVEILPILLIIFFNLI